MMGRSVRYRRLAEPLHRCVSACEFYLLEGMLVA